MAVSHCSLRLHCPMPLWIPGFRRGPTRAFAANVLNHFPMKQLNCFMSLQESITKLTHWMAQGHMESYWNDTLSFIAAPMPNAWFRPIAKQAPLSGYYNWRNEGWIHWSTASSAFRTDEELLQYGIDHGTATFPDFPLPMRDQIIAWKVPIVQPWKCKWLMGHC